MYQLNKESLWDPCKDQNENNITQLINTYVFQLIKRNLQRSMKMFCMDGTKSEALMTLKLAS